MLVGQHFTYALTIHFDPKPLVPKSRRPRLTNQSTQKAAVGSANGDCRTPQNPAPLDPEHGPSILILHFNWPCRKEQTTRKVAQDKRNFVAGFRRGSEVCTLPVFDRQVVAETMLPFDRELGSNKHSRERIRIIHGPPVIWVLAQDQ